VAKANVKTITALEPAVDDLCYLIAQSALALMDNKDQAKNSNAAAQNESDDCAPSTIGSQS
jgi:hypothetical protein